MQKAYMMLQTFNGKHLLFILLDTIGLIILTPISSISQLFAQKIYIKHVVHLKYDQLAHFLIHCNTHGAILQKRLIIS